MKKKSTATPKTAPVIAIDEIRQIKRMPCFVCQQEGPSDCGLIRTWTANGRREVFHLWPLCRWHYVERHTMPFRTFIERHQLPIHWTHGYPEIDLRRSS